MQGRKINKQQIQMSIIWSKCLCYFGILLREERDIAKKNRPNIVFIGHTLKVVRGFEWAGLGVNINEFSSERFIFIVYGSKLKISWALRVSSKLEIYSSAFQEEKKW